MPNTKRPPFRTAPLQAWLEEGLRLLAEHGIDEDAHHVKVRSRLLKSIALAYWKSLLSYADAEGLVPKVKDEEIAKAVGRRLGVHHGTISRWLSEQLCPDADKVFGSLVIVLRKEIREVRFPSNKDVALLASCRTLSSIREEVCKLGQLELKDHQEFRYVHALVRHPYSDLFLGHDRPATKEDIYSDLILFVAGRPVAVAEANVERAIARWLLPYLLFRTALMKPWEHLDDDAFRVDP